MRGFPTYVAKSKEVRRAAKRKKKNTHICEIECGPTYELKLFTDQLSSALSRTGWEAPRKARRVMRNAKYCIID